MALSDSKAALQFKPSYMKAFMTGKVSNFVVVNIFCDCVKHKSQYLS